ncbi:deoxyxylulose-5-phosphate synthase [Thermobaculum terrenum ATCC BAA-798]|uniref:1-deoxy-D-xylulose-5-phosphate synthase n=1 Tax=Thermobaculum terrenum (strain ATCC BAA-798 / CCMEE 7001 / YNP1) TaxID=525904 RepID=D1CD93_THET1|nr:1-deoxy-D-xylulose-5-phosphate synthase [Thermobaculum terrenum]ACZ42758.1 deoxyxylulose-5-phosphate synthase [Thermobaculum terrenum ATCC BAA-798]
MSRILDTIESPDQLKNLTHDQLKQLAQEMRERLVETVYGVTGGHFSSNLGTVEIAIALHTVFDSPRDKIIWDVGHQAYPHKMLTGRNKLMHTIRQYGGLAPFLMREESPHDQFGAGHASTSISAALGMAVARDMQGEDYHVVAVIGDGALTGGMALEALNNLGHLGTKMIVLLNDNEMSIYPNVGVVPRLLTRLRTSRTYHRAKGDVVSILQRMPAGDALVELGKRFKDSVKELVIPNMMWEELGLTYLGPIDGHNLADLQETLTLAKQLDRPVLIHAITIKGKGFEPAEAESKTHKWHSVTPKSPGKSDNKPSAPRYQDVFAQTLIRLAEEDERIVGITAAMPDGTSLDQFGKRFPDRMFDVGIAEQHAVTFAAGLAAAGMRPVAAIYSTFLQRAYDQVVHDVAMQNLPVVFAMDRAGIAGNDGRTHHGALDISYLRCVPNMTLMAPKDENELQHMLKTALSLEGPAAIRYPRGNGYGVPLSETFHVIPVGTWELLQEGEDLLILATGYSVYQALEAAKILSKQDGIFATVVNCRFIKPLDEELLQKLVAKHDYLITVEENVRMGGFGSAVLESLADHSMVPSRFVRLGMPDRYVEHGSQEILRKILGLDAEGIAQTARELLYKTTDLRDKTLKDVHQR